MKKCVRKCSSQKERYSTLLPSDSPKLLKTSNNHPRHLLDNKSRKAANGYQQNNKKFLNGSCKVLLFELV
jgi:hypothetical protein